MLLMYRLFSLGGADEQLIEMKHADVGANVTLTCEHEKPQESTTFYWVRFVPGSPPEVLGVAFSFTFKIRNKSSHFICERGPGTFLLHILSVTPHDEGFYYCIKTTVINMTFLQGTFLRIQGKTDLK